jgi:toxoflavin synthase
MFIPRIQPRHNALGYLLWRWLLRKNGKFCAGLERFFFGPSHGLNDYEALPDYKKSHAKPDKQYSILPTVLKLVGNTENKIIVDLGCGTGFFTIPLATTATQVFGIDNSETQLRFATKHPKVTYLEKDIFVDELPACDTIVAPFVINYATTAPILSHLFSKLYDSLSTGGTLVLVIDLPNNKKLERFGARKMIRGLVADEAPLQIDILNNGEKICTLDAIYFTPRTIEHTLELLGFKNICWHRPIVSDEGLEVTGSTFWDGYLDDPELGYLTARK